MITDALLDIVGFVLSGISALLPDVEIPMWDEVLGFADTVNGWLFAFDGWLPLRDLATAIRWIAAVWVPGYLTFNIVRFVWAHVPVLGSGG